ncbi:lipopolysaccharide kinase InaA family protein [Candidatus Berkiella cookevillensis]|uniref:3-deoxy-D-manno-octulosonic-acid kinase n=1 Tax=Candidatus Berkiella cookevillensis TaxID=437022 RepID=A0A0Q9YTX3_9GAMM|nr:lipopolysaccharide kinase InaA family protein [Candidatus Berkiella cookevillensis]MCS5707520.1 lipopolysaccharide kinase InaA family protein [Candidatus Berkiella cookevillensis]
MKVLKSFKQYIQWDESFKAQSILAVLSNIEYHMTYPERVLKNDPTSTVVVIVVDGQQWVIKRANTKGILHCIRRAFLPSRAFKNWNNAKKLLSMGVDTMRPIALLEERWGIIRGRSYFISNYIEGVDALHFFACGAKPNHLWQSVAENICNMMKKLATHRVSHRDLNLSNILINAQQKPFLIDLDAMCQYKWHVFAKRAAKKERKRFMENWSEAPNVHEQAEQLFSQLLQN